MKKDEFIKRWGVQEGMVVALFTNYDVLGASSNEKEVNFQGVCFRVTKGGTIYYKHHRLIIDLTETDVVCIDTHEDNKEVEVIPYDAIVSIQRPMTNADKEKIEALKHTDQVGATVNKLFQSDKE